MPYVEYHLLLILICLVKSGISLNLRIELGFRFIMFLTLLPMTEESLIVVSEISVHQVFGAVAEDRNRI